MGCDIHSVAQVNKDGKWRTVAHRVADDNRNYDTFAVYADVRNGRGFAGVPTGEGWKPIADPRGIPDDFEIWEAGHCGTYMGDHSHSWLLLSEIRAAWEALADKQYAVMGIVERSHYRKTIAKGKTPEEWCGGTSGPDVLIVTEEQVKAGTAPERYSHVSCVWKMDARKRLYLMEKQLQELGWTAEEYEVAPDQVRLVFGFDS
jgi:hypothetical protein